MRQSSVISALVVLVLAPGRPVVAWLPTVTKSVVLYRREPPEHRRVFALACLRTTHRPLESRFDVPEPRKWIDALKASGVIVMKGPVVLPPTAEAYDPERARRAAKRIGVDYLVASAIKRSSTRRVGMDSDWYWLGGALTVIDVRTGRSVVANLPVGASLKVSGPSMRPVAERVAETFAQAMQNNVSSVIEAQTSYRTNRLVPRRQTEGSLLVDPLVSPPDTQRNPPKLTELRVRTKR